MTESLGQLAEFLFEESRVLEGTPGYAQACILCDSGRVDHHGNRPNVKWCQAVENLAFAESALASNHQVRTGEIRSRRLGARKMIEVAVEKDLRCPAGKLLANE